MIKYLFIGIFLFVEFMFCSLISYFVGEQYGIIMAIIQLGFLIAFNPENKKSNSSKEAVKNKIKKEV